ncbi:PQQ-binding-like beta-propeller repeat protein [Thermogemmatispora carboxidivorans]|uniref:outer membrane protein assembly factor BamB family protein n=1 Tax=Thermogemmatispora carboxidivorans TaxID=1382306 RepID=UPI00069AC9D5|nr:PQQ-binding-like beta-propeller repeat protein [Thermogemmatispora carboxidivorans]
MSTTGSADRERDVYELRGERTWPWKPGRLLLVALLLCLLAACGGNTTGGTATPTVASSPSLPLPTPTASAAVTGGGSDWTTYHRDNTRSGYIAGVPDPVRLVSLWTTHLDGAVYAEPLVVHGRVIVATEGDSLYALNASNGNVLWHTRVGTPVPLAALPCGNIDPLGITGTPVYDPATNLIFAVAEVSGPRHMLVGVDADSGVLKFSRSVDPPGADPQVHQQRAALALANGRIYIAYGGLYGDCGDYRGRVVAVPTTNPQAAMLTFTVPTPREGGIWAPAGPAVAASGNIYVSVGNGAVTSGDWDHSDSVLRLSPTLQLEDGFAPTQWASDNAADLDLSSLGPVLLPNGLLFIAGKSGIAYLLRANALGGVGGQLQEQRLCDAYGGAARVDNVIYLPCSLGVLQVTIAGGPRMVRGWQAPANINGSPIVGGNTVYVVDRTGALYALNRQTGAVRARLSIEPTSRFATPTLMGRTLLIGTMSGVVAVGIA